MMVVHVIANEPSEMLFVQSYDMVEISRIARRAGCRIRSINPHIVRYYSPIQR